MRHCAALSMGGAAASEVGQGCENKIEAVGLFVSDDGGMSGYCKLSCCSISWVVRGHSLGAGAMAGGNAQDPVKQGLGSRLSSIKSRSMKMMSGENAKKLSGKMRTASSRLRGGRWPPASCMPCSADAQRAQGPCLACALHDAPPVFC